MRSTEKHVVKCFGLKWLPFCLLVPLPWSKRPWALPFLTFLQYPKKYDEARNHKHRTTINYAVIGVRLISGWLSHKTWTLFGDGGFACVELAEACNKHNGALISRLRLDARVYEFPPEAAPGKRGRKPTKGKRITPFKSMLEDAELQWTEVQVKWYGRESKTIQYVSGVNLLYKSEHKPFPVRWVLLRDTQGKAVSVPLFSSSTKSSPVSIIEQFVFRFCIEVTFEDLRAHLGVETQREWSDKAIVRSTPLLMGLFSLICLIAYCLRDSFPFAVRVDAWYSKGPEESTFSDIIAYVRRYCWSNKYLVNSQKKDDLIKLKHSVLESIVYQLSQAP